MTTLEKAARQALEALHGFIPYLPLRDEAQWGRYYEAIAALRQALEHTKQEPISMANGKIKVTLQETPAEIELEQYKRMFEAACSDLGAINNALGLDHEDGGAESILFAIEELKGHPKEPIAWMVYSLDGMSVCVTDNPTDFTPKHKALPLYTTPPKRECTGLTDEEIEDEWRLLEAIYIDEVDPEGYWGSWNFDFVRAVENKLKEKNT